MTEPKQVVIDSFPAELESEARVLHDYVLAGSDSLLRSVPDPLDRMKTDREFLRAAMCAAQPGFSKAQDHTSDQLQHPARGDSTVRVPDAPFNTENYDAELVSVLEKSRRTGWAIEHIDDCLFIGAYRGDFRGPAELIFRTWFEGCGAHRRFPFANLFLTSTRTPLALPVGCRQIPREEKFDLMFGRVVVFVAIDMNGFIRLCNSMQLPAR